MAALTSQKYSSVDILAEFTAKHDDAEQVLMVFQGKWQDSEREQHALAAEVSALEQHQDSLRQHIQTHDALCQSGKNKVNKIQEEQLEHLALRLLHNRLEKIILLFICCRVVRRLQPLWLSYSHCLISSRHHFV